MKDRPEADFRKAHLLLAREHLSRCIQQQADRVWPYLQRAMAEDELGDAAAAETDYDQAERMLRDAPDPTALYALHVNRGVGRIKRHDPVGAVPDLTQATDLEPAELPAYFDLAKAYQDQRRLSQAREQLDRAADRAGSAALADVFRSRAKVQEELNDWKAAVSDLEQAVRHEPAGPDGPAAADDLRLMGQLLLKNGQAAEALHAADAALAAAPDDPASQRIRAEALLRLDHFAEAVQALDRYVEGERRAGRRPEARVFRRACAGRRRRRRLRRRRRGLFAGAGRRRRGERRRRPHRPRVVLHRAGSLAAGPARLRADGSSRSGQRRRL